MMAVLDEHALTHVKEKFADIKDEVTMVVFKSKDGCEYCGMLEELANELKNASPKLKLEVYTLETDTAKAKEYEVDAAPAMILHGKEKRLLRFFGVPAGYEFVAFLTDIVDVSRGMADVPPEIAEKVKKIDFPVHMQVFVTPTCPYCPGAVKLAHDFALLNPLIKGDMIDASEFTELAEKYDVMGVPKTIINEKLELTGAYPMDIVLKKILEMGK
jgi:glutaredoxin-like protein